MSTSVRTTDAAGPGTGRPPLARRLLGARGAQRLWLAAAALFVLLSLVRVVSGEDALTSSSVMTAALLLTSPLLFVALGGLFAERAMRNPDQCRVRHRRMFIKDVFNFGGVDVLATPDYHVLGAIDDVAEPLLVEPREIAGTDPAIDKGCRGFFGPVPVTRNDLRTARP